ncbi:hypothetical protein WN943_018982 [Citrus x changshan-huyou]
MGISRITLAPCICETHLWPNITIRPNFHLVLKVEIGKLLLDQMKILPSCLKLRQGFPFEQHLHFTGLTINLRTNSQQFFRFHHEFKLRSQLWGDSGGKG